MQRNICHLSEVLIFVEHEPMILSEHDTDLKQIACVSPSSIISSSKLNDFKHKLFILFLKFASSVSHLEELMCRGCRFSLYCNCIRR